MILQILETEVHVTFAMCMCMSKRAAVVPGSGPNHYDHFKLTGRHHHFTVQQLNQLNQLNQILRSDDCDECCAKNK